MNRSYDFPLCGKCTIKPTLGALHNGEVHRPSQLHLGGGRAASPEDMWAADYQIALHAGGGPGYHGLYGPEGLSLPQKPESLIILETEGWTQCGKKSKKDFPKYWNN